MTSAVHISHYDVHGGAALAAYRLHEGLRRSGIESRMLVGHKGGADPDVREIPHGAADRLANRVWDRLGVQYLFLPSTLRLACNPWLRSADVLHLHNLHGGFFAHSLLPLVARRKRVVWTLHDMWAFTGHCGYSLDSDRWLVGCGKCPHLSSYPAVRRDATRFNWRVKQLVYRQVEATIVTPSEWLASLARQSPLLSRFQVRVIPYGVDLERFAPLPAAEARSAMGLPAGEPVVLVVGLERRKGETLLAPILRRAAAELGRTPTVLLAGGKTRLELGDGIRVAHAGQIPEAEMPRLYRAADVLLLPSAADNLPNSALEALACGVPTVATRVGGVPELIEDGRTGYLRPLDADALGSALAGLLRDEELRTQMAVRAREYAVRRFGLELQAREYLDLYAELG